MSNPRSLAHALLISPSPDRSLDLLARARRGRTLRDSHPAPDDHSHPSPGPDGPTAETPSAIEETDNPWEDPLIGSFASALSRVVSVARARGQSLDEVTAEVLAEDRLLDRDARRWLSTLVTQLWETSAT